MAHYFKKFLNFHFFEVNSIIVIKEKLIARNKSREDTTVYEEDSIEDGILEEGDE